MRILIITACLTIAGIVLATTAFAQASYDSLNNQVLITSEADNSTFVTAFDKQHECTPDYGILFTRTETLPIDTFEQLLSFQGQIDTNPVWRFYGNLSTTQDNNETAYLFWEIPFSHDDLKQELTNGNQLAITVPPLDNETPGYFFLHSLENYKEAFLKGIRDCKEDIGYYDELEKAPINPPVMSYP